MIISVTKNKESAAYGILLACQWHLGIPI
jgi:hypothetical protein